MDVNFAKRLSCYFQTEVQPEKKQGKMKKSKSDQILQRSFSGISTLLPARSTSASDSLSPKDCTVKKFDKIKKLPIFDLEQDKFLDQVLQFQGGRLDEQRTSMPPLLLKHQQLNMEIKSPTVSCDEDNFVKQALERGPPYPMVLLPANGEYWMEGNSHVSLRNADKYPIFPTIDMTKCNLTENDSVYNYRKCFFGKEHINFAAIDGKHGEVLLSVAFNKAVKNEDEDHYNVILRLKDKSICEVVKASQFDSDMPGPRDFLKILLNDDVDVERFHPIAYPRASEETMKFDEHSVTNCYKIGVIYQKFGQVNENEFLQNQDDSTAFREFLDMMGTCIELKDFPKYRGGLDTKAGFSGNHSYYTEYQDKEIMFHVSTLLPFCSRDTQNIGRKRHIGNDVVSIIFQDQNTPFNPSSIRSHFLHVFIVVQVEEANTASTYYKVSVVAKGGVPKFSPVLPYPSIFKKGPEFREFLLTKILNAEAAAIKSENFLKLSRRTRTTLFQKLVSDMISKNEKLLSDEFASSPSVSFAPLKNSGLLSSFRSAIRNSSRARSISSSSSGSLSSSKLSGVSLSLNDISFINSCDKKDGLIKKLQTKEDRKKVKKEKNNHCQPSAHKQIINQDSTEKSYSFTPLLQTKEDHTKDQQSKSISRFFKNELFDVIDLNNSLNVPNSLPQHISSDHYNPMGLSAADIKAESNNNSSHNLTEIEMLKDEIKTLKAEKLELLRQNYAEETKKLYQQKCTANGELISSQIYSKKFSLKSPTIPEYV